MFKIEPPTARHFLIETAAAKVAVARRLRAVTDGVVAWDLGLTRLAHDIAHRAPPPAALAIVAEHLDGHAMELWRGAEQLGTFRAAGDFV